MTSAPEDDTYDPEPADVMADGCLIADPVEFFEMTKSVAAIVRDGALFVLRREDLKWVNVESINQKPAGKLSAVKGGS